SRGAALPEREAAGGLLRAFPPWPALTVLAFSGPTSASSACCHWRMSPSGSSGIFPNFPLICRADLPKPRPQTPLLLPLGSDKWFRVISLYYRLASVRPGGQAGKPESRYNSERNIAGRRNRTGVRNVVPDMGSDSASR